MNRYTLSTTRKQPKRAENAYVFVTVSCVLRVQCAGSASLIFQLMSTLSMVYKQHRGI